MEKLGKPKRHVLRPLFWWLILVLVLYGIKLHQRLSEQTHLWFNPVLQGRSVSDEAAATLDNQPITSGTHIAIGRHQFTITHLKAEPFSTNLFIWYGRHDLGDIILKRGFGSLAITANPSAGLIDIQGPEFFLKLTNSTGITVTVPTDRYTVDAYYQHWQQRQETTVISTLPGTCTFAPRFGTVQLTCNQSGASFQVVDTNEQLFEAGDFPATIQEVPEGSYKVNAWHHGNHLEQALTVSVENTTSTEVQFDYGAAVLETEPPGATVFNADGRQLGFTPLQISELSAGQWRFQIAMNGYEGVTAALDISAQATNTFRTNLVNLNYVRSLNSARQYLAAAEYANAEQVATDALQAKPGDADATAVYNEAAGKRHLRQAEALGKQGDFVGGDKELTLVLQTLPDNEEAKQLQAAFKNHVAEQLQEQQRQQEIDARKNRPKEELTKLLKDQNGAEWFQIQEMKTPKSVASIVAALPAALEGPIHKLTISYQNSPATDVTTMVIKQGGAQSARVCCLVIGRVADDETQILFKIIESANTAFNNNGIAALLNLPGGRDYQTLRPGYGGAWTGPQNMQIQEGIQLLRDSIQKAIDQAPAN